MISVINRIKKKNIVKSFIYLCLCLLIVVIFLNLGFTKNDINDTNCSFATFEEYEKCMQQGDYFVNITPSKVEDTGYSFSKVNEETIMAKMVRISMLDENGKIYYMFGVLPVDLANKVLSKEVKTFRTHIGKFNFEEYEKGLEYLTGKLKSELNEVHLNPEEESEIMSYQFDSYNLTNRTIFMYVVILLFILMMISNLINLIFSLVSVFSLKSNHLFRYLKKNQIKEAIDDKNYLYKKGNLRVTNKYFYSFEPNKEFVALNENIVFVYDEKKKMNICLNNGEVNQINVTDEEVAEINDAIKKSDSQAVINNDKEYKKLYSKNPKKFLDLARLKNEKN